jgi:glycosyltransferase involved in cell wall biosynthesis
MKPRILFIGESSYLNTGYAVYTNEVLSRLHQTGKFDILEFGIYGSNRDPRVQQVPWKFVGNLPDNKEQEDKYNSNPFYQFGEWRFEEVCLLHKPHLVINISDFWQHSYVGRSPYRKYFNWLWLATVDGVPQNPEWLSVYADCDGLMTYSDWGKEVLEQNGLKVICSAPPSADSVFIPLNGKELKKSLGYEGYDIIGTVMRNQKRKLYPDLFEIFSRLLKKHPKTLLYCHTSYPDNGWDIPQLLLEHNLCSKVLFTYICRNCHNVVPSFYSDIITFCHNCKNNTMVLASSQAGVSNNVLSRIINLFDIYVQHAVCEGFGIPVVEAAACGINVAATDYSATCDNTRKVNGTPIKVEKLSLEAETGRYLATPSNDHLYELIDSYLSLPEPIKTLKKVRSREGFEKHYSWDMTAEKYAAYAEELNVGKLDKLWSSPPNIHHPPAQYPKDLNNTEFSKWLIVEVLGKPELLNSLMHLRLIRDLNIGFTYGGVGGYYYNDYSYICEKQLKQDFTKEHAFNHFTSLRHRDNQWEAQRAK